MHKKSKLLTIILSIIIIALNSERTDAKKISLADAIDIALNKTARGDMIRGNLEVAEQNYFARRINFYVPEISIKGAVPSYNVDESFRFFGGATQKQLYKTRDLGFNSFIELNQNLIIGGDISITANLLTSENSYPNTSPLVPSGSFIDEETRRGFFTFSYTQPLLKPSAGKYELNNTRDDFEIARLTKIEEDANLKKEIIETYIGVLILEEKARYQESMYESVSLQSSIDSMKLMDGIISEEDWLISSSTRLDAELNKFEVETEYDEKTRDLAILLEWDVTKKLTPVEPQIANNLNDSQKQTMLDSWESSVPIGKAKLNYDKVKRDADHSASGLGLTGDLTANYSTGQGNVTVDGIKEDIDTKGWSMALNFTYPLWDGGSSGAAVKSAKLQAAQAKLEYEGTKQRTRAEIVNLINQIDISYRRLGIFQKQIELAQNRLDIAETRYADGQISMITFLKSKTFLLENKIKYLEELSKYLSSRVEVEGKFLFE